MKQKGFVSSMLVLFLDLDNAKSLCPPHGIGFVRKRASGEWPPYNKVSAHPFVPPVAR